MAARTMSTSIQVVKVSILLILSMTNVSGQSSAVSSGSKPFASNPNQAMPSSGAPMLSMSLPLPSSPKPPDDHSSLSSFLSSIPASLIPSSSVSNDDKPLAAPPSTAGSNAPINRIPGYVESRCESGVKSFELITGYVYSSTSDTIGTEPGTLQLTDCLNYCQSEDACQSVNFETGLCVLFNSSASIKSQIGGASGTVLRPSQFPVFTIYAQKICLSPATKGKCSGLGGGTDATSTSTSLSRSWSFERVINHELRSKYGRKRVIAIDKIECMNICLMESEFDCRSFNYNYKTSECILSNHDRHTLSLAGKSSKHFAPSNGQEIDYFESNCIQEPNKLCDFKKMKGKILKTVDSVYRDVESVDECRTKCLASPYRCFSFDLGDPSNKVCRTSHLDTSSLTHIKEAYFDFEPGTTYELSSCYNVSVTCTSREMIARVRTNRVFSGKIYGKNQPNSCLNDISESLDFDLSMPFNGLNCEISQTSPGAFENDIVIQHHDLIVTNKDLGLSIQCIYQIGNRSVVSSMTFDTEREGVGYVQDQPYPVHAATVNAPNVSMSITDSFGQSINSARVGDSLALRFEISEKNSPYDLFVRQLVALDGSDDNEIVLIDELGCPTDGTIMTSLSKVSSKSGSKAVETRFDAFKFPTSDAVLFKAVVSPCVGQCTPAHCYTTSSDGTHRQVFSFGRRKRSTSSADNFGSATSGGNEGTDHSLQSTVKDDDVVLSKFLTVADTFPFDGESADSKNPTESNNIDSDMLVDGARSGRSTMEENLCYGPTSIIVTCLFFLFAQILIIFFITYLCIIKKRSLAPKSSFLYNSHGSAVSTAKYPIKGNWFHYKLDTVGNTTNESPAKDNIFAHASSSGSHYCSSTGSISGPLSGNHGNHCGPNCPPRSHVHVISKNGLTPFLPTGIVGHGMVSNRHGMVSSGLDRGHSRAAFSSASSVASTSSCPSSATLLVPLVSEKVASSSASEKVTSSSSNNRKNALVSNSSKLGFDSKYYY